MLAEAIYLLVYVGLIAGSFFGFSFLLKREMKTDSLGWFTTSVLLLASLQVPEIIVGIIRLILMTILAFTENS